MRFRLFVWCEIEPLDATPSAPCACGVPVMGNINTALRFWSSPTVRLVAPRNAWSGGGTSCAKHGVSASRLCPMYIRALFWHGRSERPLVRSTASRTAVLYARLDWTMLQPVGGVPCAERGMPSFWLRSLHVWTQLWCGRTVVRHVRCTAWQPPGCPKGRRWAGHWKLWSKLWCNRAVTYLARSAARPPSGCVACTHGRFIGMVGRRNALCGARCSCLPAVLCTRTGATSA